MYPITSHVPPPPPAHSQSSQLSEMLAVPRPASLPCYANFFTPEICSEQLPRSRQNKDHQSDRPQPGPSRARKVVLVVAECCWNIMGIHTEMLHSLDCSISQMSPIEAICWWEMFIFVQIYRINSNFK